MGVLGGRPRFASPNASRGSGDLDVLCDGEKDRGKALAVFLSACTGWFAGRVELRMASGSRHRVPAIAFLQSSLHLWHASANALHEPNIGTSTTGRRIRIAWRRDILKVVVYGIGALAGHFAPSARYLEVRGS